jgi:chromosome segregation ATPase
MSEIDKEKVKQFFEILLKEFKTLETELVAHRKVIEALKRQYSDLDDSLELARKNPDILRAMDKKYEGILKSWNSQLDQMKSVDEFFREWKPKGPIN